MKTSASIHAPSVWKDGGYLLLVLDVEDQQVRFLDTATGTTKTTSVAQFLAEYRESPLNPIYLALNLLVRRSVAGTLNFNAATFRRLTAMLKHNETELMKLSEKAFAREYSRVMGLEKPLTKVTLNPEKRTPMVQEMLKKVHDLGEAAETAAPTPASKTRASAKKTKAGSSDSTATRVRTTVIEKASTPNPYSPESIKHSAFARYLKGGQRSEVRADIEALGVTPATANTWLYFFSQVVKTGMQPGWDAPRKEAPQRAAKGSKEEKKPAPKKKEVSKGKKPAKKG